jgi:hypothetical protein
MKKPPRKQRSIAIDATKQGQGAKSNGNAGDPRFNDTDMALLALGRQVLWYLELEKIVPLDHVDPRFAPEVWAYLKTRPSDVPEAEVRVWVQELARLVEPTAADSSEWLRHFAWQYLRLLPSCQVPSRTPLGGSEVPESRLRQIAEESTTHIWPHTRATLKSAADTVKAFLEQHPTMDADLAKARKEQAHRTRLCNNNAKKNATSTASQREWFAQEYARDRPRFRSVCSKADNSVFVQKMIVRFEDKYSKTISESTAYRYLRDCHVDLTTGKTKDTSAKNKLQH